MLWSVSVVSNLAKQLLRQQTNVFGKQAKDYAIQKASNVI
jgi:hypothetical protein